MGDSRVDELLAIYSIYGADAFSNDVREHACGITGDIIEQVSLGDATQAINISNQCDILQVSLTLRPQTAADGTDAASPSCRLDLRLPRGYPDDGSALEVAVSAPSLPRDAAARLQDAAAQEAAQCAAEASAGVFRVCEVARGELAAHVDARRGDGDAGAQRGEESDATRCLLVWIDHMRDRAGYVQQIRRWCKELSLRGSLVFHGRRILLLLVGGGAELKRYLALHRTTAVDVDSKGRKCRERMMDVLHEGRVGGDCRSSARGDLCVVEATSLSDVEDVLRPAGLASFAVHGLPGK
ncbi:unnamed protein product [Pedinophyceae sp. YPF-701]|nr:unnamed protein product [Pedinophyceae sp. YPF-701]